MLKITTTKTNLANAIRIVENATKGGDDATISSHFLFRVVDGVVSVLASTGDKLCAVAPVVDATVTGDVTKVFTLSAWRFGQFLNISPDGNCTIDFDGTQSKVALDGRTMRFPSLDPSTFPFWDETFKTATETATVTASKLFLALTFLRPFVSNMDTRTPQMAATECRGGVLWASDSQSLANVAVPGLTNCTMRVHFADIPVLNSFLGLDQTAMISVRESPSTLFFVRPDGGVLGVTRWTYAFPTLKLDRDNPRASFTVNVENLRYGIRFLSVAMAKGDDYIRFEFRNNKLVLSVAAVAGDREEFVVDTKSVENIDKLVAENRSTFEINTNHITSILGSVTVDVATFGVNWTDKNGYILYKRTVGEKEDASDYIAIMVWRKK